MKHIPSNIQLFGPAHSADGVNAAVASGAWAFPGIGLTTSTHWFRFSLGMQEVAEARLLVVWTTRNTANKLRLVHMDNGPTNITQIGATVNGAGFTTPVPQALDVTTEFNALVAAGVDKHIGFQLTGDGVNACTLYEVQLELLFKVPEVAAAPATSPANAPELEPAWSIAKRLKQWEADQIQASD